MNASGVWDWEFMWQMFYNFMATVSPFVMMVVAVGLTAMLIGFLIGIFVKKRVQRWTTTRIQSYQQDFGTIMTWIYSGIMYGGS